MKRGIKLFAGTFLVLGFLCIGLYFAFNNENKTYKVEFETSGGSYIETQNIVENALVIKPSNPTKENSQFVNWTLNGQEYNFQTAVTSDLILVANWNTMYTISITLENQNYTANVLDGNKINISDFHFPDKEGYAIKIYSGNEEFDLSQNIMSSLNLEAKYVALNRYKVKFDSHGGSKVNDIEVWENSLIKEPTSTRNKYKLDGWYNGDTKFDFNTPITSNLSLKAKWVEVGKVTVTFESDGKTYKTSVINENTKVSKPTDPTKKGYIFEKWLYNGTEYNFNNVVTSNIKLVASFREAAIFKVTFDSDNGSDNKVVSVTEGTKVSKPSSPTKKNYEFMGWQLNGKNYDFNNVITSDMILIAHWEKESIKYVVTFNSNGGSDVQEKSVKQNETVSKPTDPVRSGYQFTGWTLNGKSYDFNSKVTSNITLEATWRELPYYTVSFDSNGGNSVPSQSIREGSNAILPTGITKNGSSFVEWQLDGVKFDFNTPITKSITLKAIWKD